MFALHYSFETEELARGMLKNVSGALKKGGRFIGVMPNSDVITAKVKGLLALEKNAAKTPSGTSATPAAQHGETSNIQPTETDDWDPEKPADASDDDWNPENPSEPHPPDTNGNNKDEDEDDWDPE
jgi:mRNA (guanine-N7-)-methyltransferase